MSDINKRCFILFNCVIWMFASVQGQKFTEVSLEAGIDHSFKVDISNFGGGVCVIDIDKDGNEDIYITGGNNPDVLYRNNGDGTFTDVWEKSGFSELINVATQGVASADINRDGYKDLLVTTLYSIPDRVLTPNYLFINNGDGTFRNATVAYGLEPFRSNSQGASFGDVNADGYPDLYIANYMDDSPDGFNIFNENTITNNFRPAKDYLFLNAQGEKFIDVSERYGIVHRGFGFQGYFSDWDNDQDLDILVANDFGFTANPNVALVNNYPQNGFEDRSDDLAMNYGMNAMGVAGADCNYDGYMDYFVTNIAASLFAENQSGQGFINGGNQIGLNKDLIVNPKYTGVPVSWGANYFDFDHDKDIDLFVCNGALNPTVRLNPNFFFQMARNRFVETSRLVGLDDPGIGRGSVVFDYDNDGDMDLLIVNQEPRDPSTIVTDSRCKLFRNEVGNNKNWIKIQLEGESADKDGIGSRIEVKLSDRTLIREIDGGSSHLSQNSTIAHFGLGEEEIIESIVVKWIGGNMQELRGVDVNRQILIKEKTESEFEDGELELKLVPSYFTDRLFIEFEVEDDGPIQLTMYDLSGKQMYSTSIGSSISKRGFWEWNSLNSLPSGMYLVSLKSGSKTITMKALKY